MKVLHTERDKIITVESKIESRRKKKKKSLSHKIGGGLRLKESETGLLALQIKHKKSNQKYNSGESERDKSDEDLRRDENGAWRHCGRRPLLSLSRVSFRKVNESNSGLALPPTNPNILIQFY